MSRREIVAVEKRVNDARDSATAGQDKKPRSFIESYNEYIREYQQEKARLAQMDRQIKEECRRYLEIFYPEKVSDKEVERRAKTIRKFTYVEIFKTVSSFILLEYLVLWISCSWFILPIHMQLLGLLGHLYVSAFLSYLISGLPEYFDVKGAVMFDLLTLAFRGLLGKAFINPKLSSRELPLVVFHELAHQDMKRGHIKRGLASAIGVLRDPQALSRLDSRRVKFDDFNKGRELFHQIKDPVDREEEIISLAKKIPFSERLGHGVFCPFEPLYTYRYGAMIAGVASELGKELKDERYAWEYLKMRERLTEKGKNPALAEYIIRSCKENLIRKLGPKEASEIRDKLRRLLRSLRRNIAAIHSERKLDINTDLNLDDVEVMYIDGVEVVDFGFSLTAGEGALWNRVVAIVNSEDQNIIGYGVYSLMWDTGRTVYTLLNFTISEVRDKKERIKFSWRKMGYGKRALKGLSLLAYKRYQIPLLGVDFRHLQGGLIEDAINSSAPAFWVLNGFKPDSSDREGLRLVEELRQIEIETTRAGLNPDKYPKWRALNEELISHPLFYDFSSSEIPEVTQLKDEDSKDESASPKDTTLTTLLVALAVAFSSGGFLASPGGIVLAGVVAAALLGAGVFFGFAASRDPSGSSPMHASWHPKPVASKEKEVIRWQGLPADELAYSSLPYLLKALGIESQTWPETIEVTERNREVLKAIFDLKDLDVENICRTLFDDDGRPLALCITLPEDEIKAVNLKPIKYGYWEGRYTEVPNHEVRLLQRSIGEKLRRDFSFAVGVEVIEYFVETRDKFCQTMLVNFPGVYPPSVSTQFLLSKIDIYRPARLLDIGCGSGILPIIFALRGSEKVLALDMNPLAVWATRFNATALGLDDVIEARESVGLFNIRKGEVFDAIISNLPLYREDDARNLFERSTLDPYGEGVKGILHDAKKHLSKGSHLYLSYSKKYSEYVKEQADIGGLEVVSHDDSGLLRFYKLGKKNDSPKRAALVTLLLASLATLPFLGAASAPGAGTLLAIGAVLALAGVGLFFSDNIEGDQPADSKEDRDAATLRRFLEKSPEELILALNDPRVEGWAEDALKRKGRGALDALSNALLQDKPRLSDKAKEIVIRLLRDLGNPGIKVAERAVKKDPSLEQFLRLRPTEKRRGRHIKVHRKRKQGFKDRRRRERRERDFKEYDDEETGPNGTTLFTLLVAALAALPMVGFLASPAGMIAGIGIIAALMGGIIWRYYKKRFNINKVGLGILWTITTGAIISLAFTSTYAGAGSIMMYIKTALLVFITTLCFWDLSRARLSVIVTTSRYVHYRVRDIRKLYTSFRESQLAQIFIKLLILSMIIFLVYQSYPVILSAYQIIHEEGHLLSSLLLWKCTIGTVTVTPWNCNFVFDPSLGLNWLGQILGNNLSSTFYALSGDIFAILVFAFVLTALAKRLKDKHLRLFIRMMLFAFSWRPLNYILLCFKMAKMNKWDMKKDYLDAASHLASYLRNLGVTVENLERHILIGFGICAAILPVYFFYKVVKELFGGFAKAAKDPRTKRTLTVLLALLIALPSFGFLSSAAGMALGIGIIMALTSGLLWFSKARASIPNPERVREILLDWKKRPDPLEVARFSREDIQDGARLAFGDEDIARYERSVTFEDLENLMPYIEKITKRLLEMMRDDPKLKILVAGRDAEIFYDILRTLLAGTGHEGRIMLFPGTEAFMEDILILGEVFPEKEPWETEFLESFGITPEAIKRGERFLLFDTGVHGTIGELLRTLIEIKYGARFSSAQISDREIEHAVPIKLVGVNYGPNERQLIDFDIDEKEQWCLFPKTIAAIKEFKKQHGMPDYTYTTNFLLATAIQLLPTYHDGYHELERTDDGRLIAVPHRERRRITEDIDTASGINDSIVNPAAAMLVQKMVIDHFRKRREGLISILPSGKTGPQSTVIARSFLALLIALPLFGFLASPAGMIAGIGIIMALTSGLIMFSAHRVSPSGPSPSKSGDEQAIKILIEASLNYRSRIAEPARQALANIEIAPEQYADYLLEHIDGHGEVGGNTTRKKAVEQLGDFGIKRFIGPLIQRLRDEWNVDVLNAVDRSLRKLGVTQKQLIDGYIEALLSIHRDTREFAARALGSFGAAAEKAMPFLRANLLKCPPIERERYYDRHGDLITIATTPHPEYGALTEALTKIRNALIERPGAIDLETSCFPEGLNIEMAQGVLEHGRVPLDKIKDERITAFLEFLREKGLDDILIMGGGGLRDALFGQMASDIDITIKVELTDEEIAACRPSYSKTPPKVYAYAMQQLERLAHVLGVDKEDFMVPTEDPRAARFKGLAIQFAGPIEIKKSNGEIVCLKRFVVEKRTKEGLDSRTAPSLLQTAIGCDGTVYGNIHSVKDVLEGKATLWGDGYNFGINGILRLLRLKHQFGLMISGEDYVLINDTIAEYFETKESMPEVLISVAERLKEKVLDNAKNRRAAEKELQKLDIIKLIEEIRGMSKRNNPRGATPTTLLVALAVAFSSAGFLASPAGVALAGVVVAALGFTGWLLLRRLRRKASSGKLTQELLSQLGIDGLIEEGVVKTVMNIYDRFKKDTQGFLKILESIGLDSPNVRRFKKDLHDGSTYIASYMYAVTELTAYIKLKEIENRNDKKFWSAFAALSIIIELVERRVGMTSGTAVDTRRWLNRRLWELLNKRLTIDKRLLRFNLDPDTLPRLFVEPDLCDTLEVFHDYNLTESHNFPFLQSIYGDTMSTLLAAGLPDHNVEVAMANRLRTLALTQLYGMGLPGVAENLSKRSLRGKVNIVIFAPSESTDYLLMLRESRSIDGVNIILVDPYTRSLKLVNKGKGVKLMVTNGMLYDKNGRPILAKFKEPLEVHYVFTRGTIVHSKAIEGLGIPTAYPTGAYKMTLHKIEGKKILDKAGIRNPRALVVSGGNDKLQVLGNEGSPVTETESCKDWREFVERFGIEEVAFKPDSRSGGIGIEFLTVDELDSKLNDLIARQEYYLVRSFIEKRVRVPKVHHEGELYDWNIRQCIVRSPDGKVNTYGLARVGRGVVNLATGAFPMRIEDVLDNLAGYKLSPNEKARHLKKLKCLAREVYDLVCNTTGVYPDTLAVDFMMEETPEGLFWTVNEIQMPYVSMEAAVEVGQGNLLRDILEVAKQQATAYAKEIERNIGEPEKEERAKTAGSERITLFKLFITLCVAASSFGFLASPGGTIVGIAILITLVGSLWFAASRDPGRVSPSGPSPSTIIRCGPRDNQNVRTFAEILAQRLNYIKLDSDRPIPLSPDQIDYVVDCARCISDDVTFQDYAKTLLLSAGAGNAVRLNFTLERVNRELARGGYAVIYQEIGNRRSDYDGPFKAVPVDLGLIHSITTDTGKQSFVVWIKGREKEADVHDVIEWSTFFSVQVSARKIYETAVAIRRYLMNTPSKGVFIDPNLNLYHTQWWLHPNLSEQDIAWDLFETVLVEGIRHRMHRIIHPQLEESELHGETITKIGTAAVTRAPFCALAYYFNQACGAMMDYREKKIKPAPD
ncbi:MAG: methyltransferase, partial [Candidatus Omnitrophica bacterium]|nr:methyltransferase [Candidatus Omnitrophota bacterium]